MIQHKSLLQNPPQPEQTIPPSVTTIVNFSPISESIHPQTEKTLTIPKFIEQNNPPVVIVTPHPCTSRGNNFPEVIIPDNRVQPKLKSQTGFVIKIVILFPSLYLYHNELIIYDLME